jgi:hypothetical protein
MISERITAGGGGGGVAMSGHRRYIFMFSFLLYTHPPIRETLAGNDQFGNPFDATGYSLSLSRTVNVQSLASGI